MFEKSNFEELDCMSCFTEVHIQLITPTQPVRLKTKLIGVDPNMAVILAHPKDHEWFVAKNFIREGQAVIVRLLSSEQPDANIFAFRSHIQKLMSISGSWLVIDYPKELQKVSLRKHSRFPVHIPAFIRDSVSNKLCSEGVINDISINGCAFVGEMIEGATVDQGYLLEVSIADQHYQRSIPVLVKNRNETDLHFKQVQYGLTFSNASVEIREFIEHILLYHLSK